MKGAVECRMHPRLDSVGSARIAPMRREAGMSKRDFLYGMAIGAAVAYIADPQAGRRRRAVARDQFARAGRKTRKALDATARDVANRTAGILAATRGRLSRAGIEDRRLVERVRAKLGRVSSNPHAI